MHYEGHLENGVVVPDEPVPFADGTKVRIQVVQVDAEAAGPSFTERFEAIKGRAHGLPADAARNHDQHLYGEGEL